MAPTRSSYVFDGLETDPGIKKTKRKNFTGNFPELGENFNEFNKKFLIIKTKENNKTMRDFTMFVLEKP